MILHAFFSYSRMPPHLNLGFSLIYGRTQDFLQVAFFKFKIFFIKVKKKVDLEECGETEGKRWKRGVKRWEKIILVRLNIRIYTPARRRREECKREFLFARFVVSVGAHPARLPPLHDPLDHLPHRLQVRGVLYVIPALSHLLSIAAKTKSTCSAN